MTVRMKTDPETSDLNRRQRAADRAFLEALKALYPAFEAVELKGN